MISSTRPAAGVGLAPYPSARHPLEAALEVAPPSGARIRLLVAAPAIPGLSALGAVLVTGLAFIVAILSGSRVGVRIVAVPLALAFRDAEHAFGIFSAFLDAAPVVLAAPFTLFVLAVVEVGREVHLRTFASVCLPAC